MKIFRQSLWEGPHERGPSMVMREADFRDWNEAMVALAKPMPPGFVTTDIFDMAREPSIQEATLEAYRRMERNADIEQNMAISYFWNAVQLGRIVPYGALGNPAPAPYDVECVKHVLRHLAAHPNYRNQMVMQRSNDGHFVRLDRGKVTVVE